MKKILVCFVALLTMILLVNNGVNATSGETNNNVVDELNSHSHQSHN